MRTWLIATAGLALAMSADAEAQQRVVVPGPSAMRPGASYPAPGTGSVPLQSWQAPRGGFPAPPPVPPRPDARVQPPGTPPVLHAGQPRWGSKVGGRWWGGANAPGGWSAYRRPYRGYAVPAYWIAPRFYISDWQSYGLTPPVGGYHWVRYYDDAVLIDARGSVYDVRDGIDWDRDDAGGYAQDDRVYAGGDYAPRGYDDHRHDSGIGGAVVGAAVGGIAGNMIAGRGNRLGGTLVGAGIGAAAGYAIDRAEDRAPPPPPARADRGWGYDDVPVAPDRAPPPPPAPPPVGYQSGGHAWRSADGVTTVTTTTGGGYYQGGYFYPGTSTTTVVVQTAPVVTTTTTDVYEDSVTYTRRPAVHRKTRRVWRPAPRCACR